MAQTLALHLAQIKAYACLILRKTLEKSFFPSIFIIIQKSDFKCDTLSKSNLRFNIEKIEFIFK